MMRVGAAVACGFLTLCLAACKGYADGKCTLESLSGGKMPPELAELVGEGEGSGLVNSLCYVPLDEPPWTIMFEDKVLRCADKEGKKACTVPDINGITITVDSDTAEPRVNTANVKLSQDRLRPLLDDRRVRYIAPNCRSIRKKSPLKVDTSVKALETGRPLGVTVDAEPACERHDSAQWGLADACIPASHEDAGSPKIVAVLDSGVDCTHPAISSRIDGGHKPTGRNKCPASAGTNYVYENEPPDHCSKTDRLICKAHGTAVAGVIASSAPEVPGVDPRAKLVSTRILHGTSGLEFVQPWTKVATAILESGKRAQIINISASWPRNYPWLAAAIDRVTADHRHLVVGSTYADDGLPYPAEFTKCNDAVIGVSDIGANPHQWPPYSWGRNSTDEAFMVAAGLAVLTSYSNENTLGSEASDPMYALQSGSSFAAPHVTGAASLVWSTKSLENCTAEGIRKILECSARITLIGRGQNARKRLHVGCLFSQRDSPICRGAQRCIESVKEQFCR